ncbi:MAG: Ku protein [Propionibacteriaceae bacterium]
MARAIWTGVISFGLVSVPVGLYSATRSHEVSFHQFEEGTEDRIRYQRVNERTGEEVEYDDIVKGTESGGGQVLLDQEELDSVAPGRSRSLEIDTFVDLDEIDPMFFQKSYYLGPRGEDTGKAYALLRDAMATGNKAAIASFVMRGKEYLAAVRADGQVLVLQTLFFADEIRDAAQELGDLPGGVAAASKELKMAAQLIDTMSGPWQPSDYHDSYTNRVKKLITAKEKGRRVKLSDEAPEATNVVDLVSALRASVDAAKKTSAKKSATTKSTTTKSTTTKSATTKSATTKSTPDRSTPKKSTPAKAS